MSEIGRYLLAIITLIFSSTSIVVGDVAVLFTEFKLGTTT